MGMARYLLIVAEGSTSLLTVYCFFPGLPAFCRSEGSPKPSRHFDRGMGARKDYNCGIHFFLAVSGQLDKSHAFERVRGLADTGSLAALLTSIVRKQPIRSFDALDD